MFTMESITQGVCQRIIEFCKVVVFFLSFPCGIERRYGVVLVEPSNYGLVRSKVFYSDHGDYLTNRILFGRDVFGFSRYVFVDAISMGNS